MSTDGPYISESKPFTIESDAEDAEVRIAAAIKMGYRVSARGSYVQRTHGGYDFCVQIDDGLHCFKVSREAAHVFLRSITEPVNLSAEFPDPLCN